MNEERHGPYLLHFSMNNAWIRMSGYTDRNASLLNESMNQYMFSHGSKNHCGSPGVRKRYEARICCIFELAGGKLSGPH